MDKWDEEEREDELTEEEGRGDLTKEERNEELKLFCTEYKPRNEDSVADVMTGRVQFAIMDQIEHMIYAADFGNPNEIKKIILRDVTNYIELYDPTNRDSE